MMKHLDNLGNRDSSSTRTVRDSKIVDHEEQEHLKAMHNSFGVSADDFRKMAFPYKLYDLLETEDPDIVHWLDHGNSFRINDVHKFANITSPRYFKHTKMESFQRQLNLYGFRRVIKGEEEGAYFHSHFQRGRVDLLPSIRRIYNKPSGQDADQDPAPSAGAMDWSSYAKPSSRTESSSRATQARERERERVRAPVVTSADTSSATANAIDHCNSIDLQDAANLLVGVYHSAAKSSEKARHSAGGASDGWNSVREERTTVATHLSADNMDSPLDDGKSSTSSTSASPNGSPARNKYDPLESLSRAALIHSNSNNALASLAAASNNGPMSAGSSYADMMKYQQQFMMSQLGHPYMGAFYRHPDAVAHSSQSLFSAPARDETQAQTRAEAAAAADSPSRDSMKSACTDSAGSASSRSVAYTAGGVPVGHVSARPDQVKGYEVMMREAMRQQEMMYQQWSLYQMRMHQQQQQQGLNGPSGSTLNAGASQANAQPHMFPLHLHPQYLSQQQQQHFLHQQHMHEQYLRAQHERSGTPSVRTTSEYEEEEGEGDGEGEDAHDDGNYASGRTSPLSSQLDTSVSTSAQHQQHQQQVQSKKRGHDIMVAIATVNGVSGKLAKVAQRL